MNNNTLYLRLANVTDINLLFEWTNDKISRLNSFNSEKITFQTHEKWFRDMMNSKQYKQFIMMNENLPVGQIRIHMEDSVGTVSYSISNKYRGLGYGSIILKLLEDWISLNNTTELNIIGLVKKNNDRSNHIFEKAGYEKIEYNSYNSYHKIIKPKHV